MREKDNNHHYGDPKTPLIYSLIFAAILICAGLYGDKIYQKYQIDAENKFVQIDKVKQFTEIYDEIWHLIDKHYYDAGFDGVDWKNAYQSGMQMAQRAKDRVDFYNNTVKYKLDLFPVSHLGVYPNLNDSDKKQALKNNSDISKIAADPILAGLNIIDIKRGKRKYNIVEDIVKDSPADLAGIQIGWYVVNWHYDYNNELQPIHFYGTFRPIAADENLSSTNSVGDINLDFAITSTSNTSSYVIKQIMNKSYIRFNDFMNSQLIDEVRQEFAVCPQNGIILDLRKNGGGDLMEMQRTISPLLPRHTFIMQTKTRSQGQNRGRSFHTLWFDKQCKAPMVVLIGPNSASASEIMAQALKHYRRATIIGRKSNGSVVGANDFILKDGTILQIPTLDIVAVGGIKLEGVGVVPDVLINPTLEDIRAGRDVALSRAIDILNSK